MVASCDSCHLMDASYVIMLCGHVWDDGLMLFGDVRAHVLFLLHFLLKRRYVPSCKGDSPVCDD